LVEGLCRFFLLGYIDQSGENEFLTPDVHHHGGEQRRVGLARLLQECLLPPLDRTVLLQFRGKASVPCQKSCNMIAMCGEGFSAVLL